ncbi:UNVERIFIED_CONTAM: hypothetical protein GTU68_063713 [Idotea baltica]|nr:hypothetical protein [Idotea baltica]
MRQSRDYEKLIYTWKAWRDAAGKPLRNTFSEYIKLLNEAALLNGFPSAAEMWTHKYESETFEKDLLDLYNQLSPLYKQLHAYVRRKLREVYGESKISKRGPIPAHVTGNMWAQTWSNIYDVVVPYPNKTYLDVTETMIQKGYSPRLMFEKADDFFASLGLERVPASFWMKSILEKPTNNVTMCVGSAWDFEDRKDFRVQLCTDVKMDDFFTIHHELGHVQYFMQYKNLPYIFRFGGNPGFHEAIGDVLSLSVSTPKHLEKIGLISTHETDEEEDINFLLKTALDTVAFLPFGYLIDRYRWDVMRGEITPQNYTKSWWNYRYEFQGLAPPVQRSESDFDPASKSHVATNTKYIRYFVSRILTYQFHKALCLRAGEYDPQDPQKPLHQCDIYQSKEAGKALRSLEIVTRFNQKKFR